jgi:hypothetical protein
MRTADEAAWLGVRHRRGSRFGSRDAVSVLHRVSFGAHGHVVGSELSIS